MKEIKIRILPYEKLGVKWFKNLFSFFLLVMVPISVGIYTGSNAMQWMGFLIIIFLIIGIASNMAKRYTVSTTDEARKLLDQIDADRT